MDYGEAVRWLESFADFERSGRFQDRPDVAPMLAQLARLGDPQLGRRTVHITGSKGKGSVAAMLESVLRAAGYRTGLYTSPHLHSYRERVQINGEPITPEGFVRLAKTLRRAVEEDDGGAGGRSLVTFDLLTALGFLAFREAGLQVQVVEVGLGGRVDSTNVFERKDVAVITPISLEHTHVLGHTVEEIAREKAAIITKGCSVVLSPQPYPRVAEIVRQAAGAAGAQLIDPGAGYKWRAEAGGRRRQRVEIAGPGGRTRFSLPLLGAHQAENAATAVAVVETLRERGAHIPEESIADGLAAVRWPARFEVLREAPLVIADGAHNRDSARRFRETLRGSIGAERALVIVGCSADKDVRGIAEELAPVAEQVLAVRSRHPRAMEPERVLEAFRCLGVRSKLAENVASALERALAESTNGGVICVLGSLFVAAEAREHLGLAKRETL